MMRNLLLIGQAPSKSGNPDRPLEGRTAVTLAMLFGCGIDEYLCGTQRYNVLPGWVGKHGKGDLFPMDLAKRNARRMRYSFGDCHVLFIGIATARMFDVRHKIMRWKRVKIADAQCGSFYAAIIPHPSGINRWWNDKDNVAAAKQFLRRSWRRCRKHTTGR
jgi:hypothetical protein